MSLNTSVHSSARLKLSFVSPLIHVVLMMASSPMLVFILLARLTPELEGDLMKARRKALPSFSGMASYHGIPIFGDT